MQIFFVNLAIARASTRFKEIGVRKVVGAVQRATDAVWGKALLLSGCALVLGMLLAALCLPTFNALADKTLALDLSTAWTTGAFLVGLTVLVGLRAGSYPAAYLSRFRPVEVLMGTIRRRGKHRLSKALVIFQFALSIMLIVGTMLLSRQVEFLRGKDLGFDAEQVVAIPTQTDHGTALMERFRQTLATRREVVRVTGGSTPISETQRAVSLRPDPFDRPAGDAGSARNDLARPGARSALYLSLPRRADRAAV